MDSSNGSARGITYGMSAEEVIRKVETGELSSCKYNSFAEYVKAMES